MLAFEEVGLRFRGGASVSQLSMRVAPGEIVALVGLNGAGKTTLMRLALGMLRPRRGIVRLFGTPIDELPAAAWAGVGALIEHPPAYLELTVRENLSIACALRGAASARVDEALRMEILKLRRSPVGAIGTVAIVVGTPLLLGGITAALASGDRSIAAKVGAVAATRDWSGLLAAAAQITSAGAMLGFGIVLAWIVGREFTDATIGGLFALPVGRGRILLAKLTIFGAWAVAVSLALAVGVMGLGLGLGYGAPSGQAWASLGRQAALGVLSAAAAVPVAWIATLARSVLAGVGGAIALVVIAQVGALTGIGGWIPPAAPALWALSGGSSSPATLALTLAMAACFAALTAIEWSRLQLDR